jgi:hypothetical protein
VPISRAGRPLLTRILSVEPLRNTLRMRCITIPAFVAFLLIAFWTVCRDAWLNLFLFVCRDAAGSFCTRRPVFLHVRSPGLYTVIKTLEVNELGKRYAHVSHLPGGTARNP